MKQDHSQHVAQKVTTTLQLIHETRSQPARSTESNTTLQLIHETRSQPARSTESNTTLQLIHETPDVNGMYKELDKEIQTAPEYSYSLDEL